MVSVNHYAKDGGVDPAWWDRLDAMVQKPVMITEFSWRAMENRSGNRNTLGADVTVPAQHDRAERSARFVPALMARPFVVGMHWFQWADEPVHGRDLDGEDSHYGHVDWQDQAYEELANAAAKRLRLTGSAPAGAKFHVMIFEKEDAGGDGECWMSDLIPTPGGKIAIDLSELERNAHAGNQKGNQRLDLDALREAGFYFHSKQGTGVVRAASLELAE